MRATSSTLCVVFLAAALGACGVGRNGPLLAEDPSTEDAEYSYVIPAGTADRIRQGVSVEILPATLEVRVGESIRIVNEDDEGHFIGIFYVGPGETVTQRFASAGEFVGNCTVHPSGTLTLRVSA